MLTANYYQIKYVLYCNVLYCVVLCCAVLYTVLHYDCDLNFSFINLHNTHTYTHTHNTHTHTHTGGVLGDSVEQTNRNAAEGNRVVRYVTDIG